MCNLSQNIVLNNSYRRLNFIINSFTSLNKTFHFQHDTNDHFQNLLVVH